MLNAIAAGMLGMYGLMALGFNEDTRRVARIREMRDELTAKRNYIEHLEALNAADARIMNDADLTEGENGQNLGIDAFARTLRAQGMTATRRTSLSTDNRENTDPFLLTTVLAMDGSGRHVVMATQSPDLVDGKTLTVTDIVVRDRDTDGDGIFDEPGAVATIPMSRQQGPGGFGDFADADSVEVPTSAAISSGVFCSSSFSASSRLWFGSATRRATR